VYDTIQAEKTPAKKPTDAAGKVCVCCGVHCHQCSAPHSEPSDDTCTACSGDCPPRVVIQGKNKMHVVGTGENGTWKQVEGIWSVMIMCGLRRFSFLVKDGRGHKVCHLLLPLGCLRKLCCRWGEF
jgi:hypothetical protein